MIITDYVLDFLFPKKCGICDKFEENGICNDCYNQLLKYKEENNEENKLFLYRYEDIIRDKIIQFKFEDKSFLKSMFAELIARNEVAMKFIHKYDFIVPVPVHFKRYLERGYNQTALILDELKHNKKIDKKMITEDVLIKRINTKPQSTKNRKERAIRSGAFQTINHEKIKDKKVLVFDDIYTTGNTINECMTALLDGGAKDVGALTIARTELRKKQ